MSIFTTELNEQISEIVSLREAKGNAIQLLVRSGNQLHLKDFKIPQFEKLEDIPPVTIY